MSDAKVSEWHSDRWGYVSRVFTSDSQFRASHADRGCWVAWRCPSALAEDEVRGPADDIDDAMAKADAQLREWGLL